MKQDNWLPDLDSLRCLLVLGKRNNFRAAAAEVGLSAAAFSERIKRLEEALETELFHRTTRRVSITPAGLRVLSKANELVRSARELKSVALDETIRSPYALTIGTRFELGLDYILPAIRDIEEKIEGLTLHLRFGDGPELLDAVLQRDIDCFISSIRLTEGPLAYSVLHHEEYVLAASPRLLEETPLLDHSHARHHTLLDLTASLPLFKYFFDSVPPDEVWCFLSQRFLGSISAVRHYARNGHGIAVLPRYFIEEDLKRQTLVPILPHIKPMHDYFRLVWKNDHAYEHSFHQIAKEFRSIPLR